MNSQKIMQEKDIRRVSAAQAFSSVFAKILVYAFLIVMALIVLFPFYWMLISSVKSIGEYRLSVPTLFPREILWRNYLEAFTQANLGKLFLNTMYVGLVSTLLSLVITVLSAFAFARLDGLLHRPDRALSGQRVLHLPAPPELSADPQRAVSGRQGGRHR